MYVFLFKELQILVCTCTRVFDSYFTRILTHVPVSMGRILKQLCPTMHLCLSLSLYLSLSFSLCLSVFLSPSTCTVIQEPLNLYLLNWILANLKKNTNFFEFLFLLYNFNYNLTRRSRPTYLPVRLRFRIPDLHMSIHVPALYMHISYYALEE
jgi:hypothetical protein